MDGGRGGRGIRISLRDLEPDGEPTSVGEEPLPLPPPPPSGHDETIVAGEASAESDSTAVGGPPSTVGAKVQPAPATSAAAGKGQPNPATAATRAGLPPSTRQPRPTSTPSEDSFLSGDSFVGGLSAIGDSIPPGDSLSPLSARSIFGTHAGETGTGTGTGLGLHDDSTAAGDMGALLDETVVAGRYRIEEPIGEGGMGRVFRARHRRLGKSFALKLMRHAFTGDSRARELFYREARLASSLSHPNIVSIIDFGEDPRLGAFMVMELLDGEPLSVRLRGDGRFPLKATLEILAQVAEALHYIHQRRVVHCDIKPDNILLVAVPGTERRKYAVKLLDFGLARVGSASTRISQHIDGTPEYMAPERIRGQQPKPSMDIYGLGVLAYEMLTGRLPFRGSLTQVMDAHIRQPPPPLSKVLREPIDERAEALVMKALEKDPANRQKDMAAFLYELRTLMDMLGFGRRRAAAPRPAVTRPKDKRTEAATLGFDGSPLPMAGLDADGTIIVANRAFAQFLTGQRGVDVEGLDVQETKFMEVHPGFAADLRKVHVQGTMLQQVLHLRGHDGTPVNLMLWMVPGGPEFGEVHVTIHSLDQPGAREPAAE